MKSKGKSAIELFWLLMSIVCLITGLHQTYYEGIAKSYPFFIFAVVAYLLFLVRKNMRKRNSSN